MEVLELPELGSDEPPKLVVSLTSYVQGRNPDDWFSAACAKSLNVPSEVEHEGLKSKSGRHLLARVVGISVHRQP